MIRTLLFVLMLVSLEAPAFGASILGTYSGKSGLFGTCSVYVMPGKHKGELVVGAVRSAAFDAGFDGIDLHFPAARLNGAQTAQDRGGTVYDTGDWSWGEEYAFALGLDPSGNLLSLKAEVSQGAYSQSSKIRIRCEKLEKKSDGVPANVQREAKHLQASEL